MLMTNKINNSQQTLIRSASSERHKPNVEATNSNPTNKTFKGELTKNFLFLFSLDQVSLISLLKYFPPKMSLT